MTGCVRPPKKLSVAERAGDRVVGRGWRADDAPVLLGFGAACSVASALVYCLYITSDEVTRLYDHPDLLWLGLPIFLTRRIAFLVSNR